MSGNNSGYRGINFFAQGISGCLRAAAMILTAGILFVCTRDYNPFTDASNARATIISSSFTDGGNGEVFARETIEVVVAASELVKQFTVIAKGNRLSGGDTTINIETLPAGSPRKFLFEISWYDTGWQTVEIRTNRKDGAEVREQLTSYRVSPVFQDTVYGTFDREVSLLAAGVKDKDVMYHWDLGRGAVFESPDPDISVLIHDADYDGVGAVWVSDVQGAYISPHTGFRHFFNDTIGPSVTCINENISGDTVRTGSTPEFFFRVRISDRETTPDAVLIDGAAYDAQDGTVYIKVYYNLDQVPGPQSVTVWAMDNPVNRNETSRMFYLVFDSSLSGTGDGGGLSIQVPSHSSTVTSVDRCYLLGRLSNLTGEKAVLAMDVNGDNQGEGDTITAGPGVLWTKVAILAPGENIIRLIAATSSGKLIDDTSFVIIFDANLADSRPPEIVEMTIGGKPAHNAVFADDTVILRILAFDEGAGIETLTVGGQAATASDTAGIWYAPLNLIHEGNDVAVAAVDSAGFVADTVIVVYQNNRPEIKSSQPLPYLMVTGGEYSGSLVSEDKDGDRVYFRVIQGSPDGIVVGDDGAVSWSPTESDIGQHELKILFYDDIDEAVYSCSLNVVDSAHYANPPVFSVTEQNFPGFVTANADTVDVTLSTQAKTGSPPFTFSAVRHRGSVFENIPVNGNRFVWAPETADTGYQHFVIVVRDVYFLSDTLYPAVLVAGPNRPCGLGVRFNIDTLPDGSIDMREPADAETLFFSITDPDIPETESYAVSVSIGSRTDEWSIQGGDSFYVILSPEDAQAGRDTLRVGIEDMGGYSSSMELPVIYFDEEPARSVVINTSATGEPVTGDVYHFPLLVRLTQDNFTFSLSQDNGSGIRFKKTDGTILPMTVEYWDNAGQEAGLWVLCDTIRGNNAVQHINMYQADISEPGGTNSAAVFDTTNGFCGVWHLDTVSTCRDATKRANHGTNNNTANVEGVINRAASFAGYSDGQNIILPAGCVAGITGTISVSFWMWKDRSISEVLFGATGNTGSLIGVYLPWNTGGGSFPCYIHWDFGRDMDDRISRDTTTAFHKQWSYWTFTHNSASGNMYIYRDGNLWHSGTSKSRTIDASAITKCRLGSSSENTYWWEGYLDEFRISKTERSAAWIKMNYQNQKPGSRMVTIQ